MNLSMRVTFRGAVRTISLAALLMAVGGCSPRQLTVNSIGDVIAQG